MMGGDSGERIGEGNVPMVRADPQPHFLAMGRGECGDIIAVDGESDDAIFDCWVIETELKRRF